MTTQRHLGRLVTIGLLMTGGAATQAGAATNDYCAAHLELEAAAGAEDPAAAEAAVAAATAAAPEEIAAALETAISTAPTEEGPPSEEFTAAYGEVVAWVRDNCGFAALDVVASDYAFGGIQPEVAGGPTIVSLANEGEELHEIVLLRKNDGVTESFEALLELPEGEAFEMVTFVGSAYAAPGETGSVVVDLTPGEYLAICFVPVGLTADVLAEPHHSFPEGPPHFIEGMLQEFVVT